MGFCAGPPLNRHLLLSVSLGCLRLTCLHNLVPTLPQNKMASLSKNDVEEITEVFELFDFWDGRDGDVDAFKVGDMCFCMGLNPTQETISKNGGTGKMGEKAYKLNEFLPIYETISKEKDTGTFADFMEAFKTFDREGQGFMSAAELRHVLTGLGEKLSDAQVDDVIKATDTREDLEGNVKYEDFIQKILKGPEM